MKGYSNAYDLMVIISLLFQIFGFSNVCIFILFNFRILVLFNFRSFSDFRLSIIGFLLILIFLNEFVEFNRKMNLAQN